MTLGLLALEQDRDRVAPLLSQLKAGTRCWQDLTGSEHRVLGRGPIIDFLLETSYSLRFEDPQRMVAAAKAACAVADGLGTRRYGRHVVADLRARAWAELANAYRVVDDFEHAGPAYARAMRRADEGTRSSDILARVSELVAHYLTDLRRFAEAAPLLEQSHDLYALCAEYRGVERCLLSLAFALTTANEPDRAIDAYLRALRQVPPDSPHFLTALHGLALNLVESGRAVAAQKILQRYRYLRLYRRSGKINEYRRYWLEGKIEIGLQNYGKAEGKLQTARLAFLRVDQAYVAALVSLDLAWVYARQGRRHELVYLVEQMLRTFRALGIAREAIASLLLLKKSCEQQRPIEALCGQIEALAKLLPELQQKGSGKRAGD